MKKLILIILVVILITPQPTYALRPVAEDTLRPPAAARSTEDAKGELFIDGVRTRVLRDYLKTENLIQSFSGIRGRFGRYERLNSEQRWILSLCAYLFMKDLISKNKNKKFLQLVIGQDPRPTGDAIKECQIRGFLAAAFLAVAKKEGMRLKIVDLGILPKPMTESAVGTLIDGLRSDGGVVITGSHNPLNWNGLEFLTGHKIIQGQPCGGSILPAEAWDKLIKDFASSVDMMERGEFDEFVTAVNDIKESEMSEAVSIASLDILKSVKQDYISRRLCGDFNLTPERLAEFRKNVEGMKAVVDVNGGAGCRILDPGVPDFGILAEILRDKDYFALDVVEINNELGRPAHSMNPDGEDKKTGRPAIQDLIEAVVREGAAFGVGYDSDADRGILVFLDAEGKAHKVGAQETAAFSVAMSLAWQEEIGELKGKPTVIVAHGPTSASVEDIAESFGAKVKYVETGESNVVAGIEGLSGESYNVPIGVEGANGGCIFGSSTCRDGTESVIMAALAKSNPSLYLNLLRKSEESGKLDPTVEKNILEGNYTLDDIRQSLPRYYIEQDKITVRNPPQKKLKTAMERIFQEELWQVLSENYGYEEYTVHYYEGKKETKKEMGGVPGKLMVDETGGWKISMKDKEGNKAFIWMRYSKTVPNTLRIQAEAVDEERARVLMSVLRNLYYDAKKELEKSGVSFLKNPVRHLIESAA